MTDWKKLPGKVVYFPSPHTSETGSMARGERGVSYTSCLPTAGGENGPGLASTGRAAGCLVGLVSLTQGVSIGAGSPHL